LSLVADFGLWPRLRNVDAVSATTSISSRSTSPIFHHHIILGNGLPMPHRHGEARVCCSRAKCNRRMYRWFFLIKPGSIDAFITCEMFYMNEWLALYSTGSKSQNEAAMLARNEEELPQVAYFSSGGKGRLRRATSNSTWVSTMNNNTN
jgi:hypothetical protein